MTTTADHARSRTDVRAAAAKAAATVSEDARRWWLVAAQPPSLTEFVQDLRVDPKRVPDQSTPLRVAWTADNYTTGMVVRALSVVLFLAAAALAWSAGHPLRRWAGIAITTALTIWIVVNHL